jgi:hypothetical protein
MHGQGIHYISETAPPKHKNDVEYLNNRAALLDNNITQDFCFCANGTETDRGEGIKEARTRIISSYAYHLPASHFCLWSTLSALSAIRSVFHSGRAAA